jgi:hypothetical protein
MGRRKSTKLWHGEECGTELSKRRNQPPLETCADCGDRVGGSGGTGVTCRSCRRWFRDASNLRQHRAGGCDPELPSLKHLPDLSLLAGIPPALTDLFSQTCRHVPAGSGTECKLWRGRCGRMKGPRQLVRGPPIRAKLVKAWAVGSWRAFPGESTLAWRGVDRSKLSQSLGQKFCKGGLWGDGDYFTHELCKALQHTRAKACSGTCQIPRLCVCKVRTYPVTVIVYSLSLGVAWHPREEVTRLTFGRCRTSMHRETLAPTGFDSVIAHGGVDPEHSEIVLFDHGRSRARWVCEIELEDDGPCPLTIATRCSAERHSAHRLTEETKKWGAPTGSWWRWWQHMEQGWRRRLGQGIWGRRMEPERR